MERHASAPPRMAESESCRAYKGSIICCFLSLPFPQFSAESCRNGSIIICSKISVSSGLKLLWVGIWLVYGAHHPKIKSFLSFLHSKRGRVVGLWVHYEPQQALSVLRGGGGNGSNSAVPNPPAFYWASLLCSLLCMTWLFGWVLCVYAVCSEWKTGWGCGSSLAKITCIDSAVIQSRQWALSIVHKLRLELKEGLVDA